MRPEPGPDFYDRRMKQHVLPLEESPWLSVYENAANMVPDMGAAIADLGCGTGRLARLLQIRGVTRYWGVDFSEKRVNEARRYVPGLEFTVGNFFEPDIRRRFPRFDTFLIIEVLEHIRDDLELLAAVPSGSCVVFSVPNFRSAGHVRFFRSASQAVKRYKSLVDFAAGQSYTCKQGGVSKRMFPFTRNKGLETFLFSAVRL